MATVDWRTAKEFCFERNMFLAKYSTNLLHNVSFARTKFYWVSESNNCKALMDHDQAQTQIACDIQCDTKSAFICQQNEKGKIHPTLR